MGKREIESVGIMGDRKKKEREWIKMKEEMGKKGIK